MESTVGFNLPIFQTKDKNFSLMQTSWKAALTPVLQNEINQGLLISNVPISAGVNTINHLLSRNQQGYIITDITAAATLFRSQPLNDKTLTLTSSANCVISLWVF